MFSCRRTCNPSWQNTVEPFPRYVNDKTKYYCKQYKGFIQPKFRQQTLPAGSNRSIEFGPKFPEILVERIAPPKLVHQKRAKSVPRSHEPTGALRFFKMAAPRGHLLNLLVILFFGLRGTPFISSRCVSSSRHNLGKSTSPKSDGIVRILGRQCWFSVFTGKSNYIKLSISE